MRGCRVKHNENDKHDEKLDHADEASEESKRNEDISQIDANGPDGAGDDTVSTDEAAIPGALDRRDADHTAKAPEVHTDIETLPPLEDAHAEIDDDEDSSWDGKPKRYKTVLAVFSTFLIMFCLVVGVGVGFAGYVAKMLSPTESSDVAVRITIPSGSNSSKIASILEEHGLIRHGKIFGYYLRYKDEGKLFQAGTYDMFAGMEIDEIIDKLNRGDTVQIEMIRFTIQEGLTISQMADKLSEDGYINRDKFLDLVAEPKNSGSSSAYIKHIPDNPLLRVPMEGYLFPETYELVKGSNEQEIIQRMSAELDRKLATLPVGWEIQLEELDMSFHEMMTIASMIEREVVVDAERSIVSGIIQNRLQEGMLLQIDATVQYALGEHRDIVSTEDTRYDDPYNTYVVQGLPPGPIAAPGILSIRAALYPETTDYFYYVTKKDGTYEHYFAKTYEEHLRNDRKSRNN